MANNLHHIYLSPQNKNFKYLDENEKVIIGKSDPNIDIYDMLYIGIDNINQISIPSIIKEIKPYALKITFENNSNLKKIGYKEFDYCLFKSIEILVSVEELENGWTGERKALSNIKIHPNNNFFKNINDSILVGKSNKNSKEFDVHKLQKSRR